VPATPQPTLGAGTNFEPADPWDYLAGRSSTKWDKGIEPAATAGSLQRAGSRGRPEKGKVGTVVGDPTTIRACRSSPQTPPGSKASQHTPLMRSTLAADNAISVEGAHHPGVRSGKRWSRTAKLKGTPDLEEVDPVGRKSHTDPGPVDRGLGWSRRPRQGPEHDGTNRDAGGGDRRGRTRGR